MSRLVTREATLSIDGDERDVPVRCWVDVGAVGDASLDGSPEMLVDGEWQDIPEADADRLEDALCEQAINEETAAYNDRDPGDFL